MQSSATLDLVENVRRLMKDEGWSQTELAKRAGISQRAVSYLLNYRDAQDRHPTTETIEGIAGAFGLQVWQLMIPDLPLELLQSQRFSKLIENYRDAPEEGRRQVERIAESEVKYAVAETVLTGKKQSGSGKS
jgi:transcriptional regulator with XRE-family HTH domain